MPALATVRRVGGMVTEQSEWPNAPPGSEIPELPCVLSRNTTHWRGFSEGRRGSRILFARTPQLGVNEAVGVMGLPGPGLALATGIAGSIPGTWAWRSRGGAGIEYFIIAGYNVAGAGGAGTATFRVVVYSGHRIQVAAQTFSLPAGSNLASLSDEPLHGFGFGDSFFITGPTLQSTTPVGFIRVRVQRTGVTIAEAELVDRDLNPYSPGDDPGPYLGRIQQASAMTVFQHRVCLASGNRVYTSNVGDPFGWSATQYVDLPGQGNVVALAPGDRYLLVMKERGGAVLTGGLTSQTDTSVDVIDQKGVGALTHRGLLTVPGGHITLNHEGVFFLAPNAQPAELSKDIRNFLQGDVGLQFGGDASRYLPVRSSFYNAPGAYLPGRREVYYALSTGTNTPVRGTDSGDVRARPNGRDLMLVGHIGNDKVRWSIQENGNTRIVDSLCGWVDADGFDRLLSGTHDGRVMVHNVGDTDQIAATQANPGTHTAYTVERQLAPVTVTRSGRASINRLEVAFGEVERSTSAQLTVRYAAGNADGGFSTTRDASVIGSNALPIYGSSYPLTMRPLPVTRRTPGVRALVTSEAIHLQVRGMAPVTHLTIHGPAGVYARV